MGGRVRWTLCALRGSGCGHSGWRERGCGGMERGTECRGHGRDGDGKGINPHRRIVIHKCEVQENGIIALHRESNTLCDDLDAIESGKVPDESKVE